MDIRDLLIQQISQDGQKYWFLFLESSPGKSPKNELKELSAYFNSKSDEEKEIFTRLIKLSVHSGIFNMLCMMDNVNKLDDVIDNMKLSAVRKDQEILLNNIRG